LLSKGVSKKQNKERFGGQEERETRRGKTKDQERKQARGIKGMREKKEEKMREEREK